ncbi:MAG: cell division protein SepF [Lachnospiraceae bacterium]|nr:cell division protein SepF [Lachnospiraceae bacterium]
MGFFGDLLQSVRSTPSEEGFEAYEEELEYEQQQQHGKSHSKSFEGNNSGRSRGTSQHDHFDDYGQPQKAHVSDFYGTSTYIEGKEDSKRLRIEHPNGSKVVPLKTTNKGSKVCVMKPKFFEDSQDICDVILSDCCAIVILNTEDLVLSQRIMDFVSGAVYSLNGKLFQISDSIVFVAPENVDVSGDYNDILEQTGYNVSLLK